MDINSHVHTYYKEKFMSDLSVVSFAKRQRNRSYDYSTRKKDSIADKTVAAGATVVGGVAGKKILGSKITGDQVILQRNKMELAEKAKEYAEGGAIIPKIRAIEGLKEISSQVNGKDDINIINEFT